MIFQIIQINIKNEFYIIFIKLVSVIIPMTTSRWDCLPDDVQESIVIRRTRLCFQDCLEEYARVGPHAQKVKCVETIKSIIDSYGDALYDEDDDENSFGDLYATLYNVFFECKEIMILNQCLFGFAKYESIDILIKNNCYTMRSLDHVLQCVQAFKAFDPNKIN